MRNSLITFCLLVSAFTNLLSQNPEKLNSASADTGYVLVDGGKLYIWIPAEAISIPTLHNALINKPKNFIRPRFILSPKDSFNVSDKIITLFSTLVFIVRGIR